MPISLSDLLDSAEVLFSHSHFYAHKSYICVHKVYVSENYKFQQCPLILLQKYIQFISSYYQLSSKVVLISALNSLANSFVNTFVPYCKVKDISPSNVIQKMLTRNPGSL